MKTLLCFTNRNKKHVLLFIFTKNLTGSEFKEVKSKGGELYNPDVGLRSGLNIKAGKNIKVLDNGFEDFDDYFSPSEDEDSVNGLIRDLENAPTSPRTVKTRKGNRTIKSMSPFSSVGTNSSLASLRRHLADGDTTITCTKNVARVVPQPQVTEKHIENPSAGSAEAAATRKSTRLSAKLIGDGDGKKLVPVVEVTPLDGKGEGLEKLPLNRVGGDNGTLTAADTMVTSKKLPEPSSALQHFKTRKRLTYSRASEEGYTVDTGRPSSTTSANPESRKSSDQASFRVPVEIPVRRTRSSIQHSTKNERQSTTHAVNQDSYTNESRDSTTSVANQDNIRNKQSSTFVAPVVPSPSAVSTVTGTDDSSQDTTISTCSQCSTVSTCTHVPQIEKSPTSDTHVEMHSSQSQEAITISSQSDTAVQSSQESETTYKETTALTSRSANAQSTKENLRDLSYKETIEEPVSSSQEEEEQSDHSQDYQMSFETEQVSNYKSNSRYVSSSIQNSVKSKGNEPNEDRFLSGFIEDSSAAEQAAESTENDGTAEDEINEEQDRNIYTVPLKPPASIRNYPKEKSSKSMSRSKLEHSVCETEDSQNSNRSASFSAQRKRINQSANQSKANDTSQVPSTHARSHSTSRYENHSVYNVISHTSTRSNVSSRSISKGTQSDNTTAREDHVPSSETEEDDEITPKATKRLSNLSALTRNEATVTHSDAQTSQEAAMESNDIAEPGANEMQSEAEASFQSEKDEENMSLIIDQPDKVSKQNEEDLETHIRENESLEEDGASPSKIEENNLSVNGKENIDANNKSEENVIPSTPSPKTTSFHDIQVDSDEDDFEIFESLKNKEVARRNFLSHSMKIKRSPVKRKLKPVATEGAKPKKKPNKKRSSSKSDSAPEDRNDRNEEIVQTKKRKLQLKASADKNAPLVEEVTAESEPLKVENTGHKNKAKTNSNEARRKKSNKGSQTDHTESSSNEQSEKIKAKKKASKRKSKAAESENGLTKKPSKAVKAKSKLQKKTVETHNAEEIETHNEEEIYNDEVYHINPGDSSIVSKHGSDSEASFQGDGHQTNATEIPPVYVHTIEKSCAVSNLSKANPMEASQQFITHLDISSKRSKKVPLQGTSPTKKESPKKMASKKKTTRKSPSETTSKKSKKAMKKLTSTQIPKTVEFTSSDDEHVNEDNMTSSPALSPITQPTRYTPGGRVLATKLRHGCLLDDTDMPTPPTVTKRLPGSSRRRLINSYVEKEATYREADIQEEEEIDRESERENLPIAHASPLESFGNMERSRDSTNRSRDRSRDSGERSGTPNSHSRKGSSEADDESYTPEGAVQKSEPKKRRRNLIYTGKRKRKRKQTASTGSSASPHPTPQISAPVPHEATLRSGHTNLMRRKSILVTRDSGTPSAARRKSVTIVQPPRSPRDSMSRLQGTMDDRRNSTMLPRYSVASPLHYYDHTRTDTLEPIYAPSQEQDETRIIQPKSDEGEPGLRRSRRTRVKRLRHGEHIEYGFRRSGAFIIGIAPPPVPDDRIKRKPRDKHEMREKQREKIKPYDLSIHTQIPNDAQDANEQNEIPVVGPDPDKEIFIACAQTRKEFEFVAPDGSLPAETDPLILTRVFKEKTFTLGQVILRPFQEKSTQFVRKDTMIFTVLYGKVAVTIHRTTIVLETEGVFFVPPGNVYSIKNLRHDEAKLQFVQHKGNKSF